MIGNEQLADDAELQCPTSSWPSIKSAASSDVPFREAKQTAILNMARPNLRRPFTWAATRAALLFESLRPCLETIA